MRFVLTISIWIIIVGGLWMYTSARDTGLKRQAGGVLPVVDTVDETFVIEITPTFGVEKDPFALQTGDMPEKGVELRLNGQPLDLGGETMAHGKVFRLSGVTGVNIGYNEVYLKASPPVVENDSEHGVRLKIVQGDTIIADETMWSSGGSLVSGTLSFIYEKLEAGHDH